MDGRKIYVGRGSGCDYIIEPTYSGVSTNHCTITEQLNDNTQALLCYRLDDYSTNGTYINAQFVHNAAYYIRKGDHITLGQQYVLSWDEIEACFAALSKKTVIRGNVHQPQPQPQP
ncbi:MAG: FHA domain-containing protein, partial [Paludibacteraceae bacterium]|nr:FHA domain-containing protein [Paludibacteraceae bacterium]